MKKRKRAIRPSVSASTKTDVFFSKLKNNYPLALIIIAASIAISVSTFLEALRGISNNISSLFNYDLQIVTVHAINTNDEFGKWLSGLKKNDINNWKDSLGIDHFAAQPLIPLLDITFSKVGDEPLVIHSAEVVVDQIDFKGKKEPGFVACGIGISGYYNVAIDPALNHQIITFRLSEGVLPRNLLRIVVVFGSTIDIDYVNRLHDESVFDFIHYYRARLAVSLKFAYNDKQIVASAPVMIEFNDNPCLSQMKQGSSGFVVRKR
jgi:hypothetical protein